MNLSDSRKHLSRRTMLRGLGVSVALPLLDSMVPAQTPLAKTAAAAKPRFCGIYVPHGATMDKWTPAREGAGFEFPESLASLEKLRDRVCVVSNLAHPQAGGIGSDAGADHARSAAVFLSGAHPEKGSVHAGMTIDQVLAAHIGQDTPLPSIEMAIEEVGLNCGSGTDARISTPSRGAARRCRCPWRTVRRSSSSASSAMAATPPSAFRARNRTPAFSIPSLPRPPASRASSIRRPRPDGRISRRHPRNRAPHSKSGRAILDRVKRSRSPRRHSRSVRRSHQAHVRFDGPRLARRDHAHFNADVRARYQRGDLPRQRCSRWLPRRIAPLQRPRQYG